MSGFPGGGMSGMPGGGRGRPGGMGGLGGDKLTDQQKKILDYAIRGAGNARIVLAVEGDARVEGGRGGGLAVRWPPGERGPRVTRRAAGTPCPPTTG